MTNRKLMYKAIQLMEDNLKSDMTVKSVADEIGFSPYYFSRLFKGVAGMSPKVYFNSRRLTDSLDLLKGDELGILEIALEYGFGSSESYSRAFNRQFGMNPSAVKKGETVDGKSLVDEINENTIERQPFVVESEPEYVELETIRLVGIPFFFDLSQKNDLADQWQLLIDQTPKILNKVVPYKYYQMQFWHPDQTEEGIYFFVGIEVTDTFDVPMHLTEKVIPQQKYLRFLHRGLANTVGYTYRYIYEEWLPRSSVKLPFHYNFEHYGEAHLGPYNPESITEIFIPII